MRKTVKLTLFCLSISSLMFAADYRFLRIDFPGAILTYANGINARGDIVGRYDDGNGRTHGFLLRKGVFTTIDFPGAVFTVGRAINARGDVVGRVEFADGVDHAFLLRDGQFRQIDFPGSSATIGRGLNNAGDVTGNYTDSAGDEVAFVLREGKFYSISVNPCSSDVWMAMDNGLVMVGDNCTDPSNALHGFLRDRQGTFHVIDFPGLSVPCTAPRWINERGDIAGLFAYVRTVDDCYNNPPLHGFLLRHDKYVSLDFPGASSTGIFAINDDGEIVGNYTDRNGNQHGFKAVPKDEE